MSNKKNILENESRIDILFVMVHKLWEDERGEMTIKQLEDIKKEARDLRRRIVGNEEDYTEDYNAKIVALEQKVDSLHHINDELTFKIDTLNGQISKLDQQIDLKTL